MTAGQYLRKGGAAPDPSRGSKNRAVGLAECIDDISFDKRNELKK